MRDPYYATKPSAEFEPSARAGTDFVPGRGVDLSDPDAPIVAPWTAFEMPSDQKASLEQARAQPVAADISTGAWQYRDSFTLSEEATILSAHFKASYGAVSARAAYRRLQSDTRDRKTIYALYVSTGAGYHLPDPAWRSAIDAESAPEQIRMDDFIARYGTHYISDVTLGYKFAVRATIYSRKQTDITSFSAAVKATIGKASGGGKLSKEHREILTQSNTDLVAEITSGPMTPDRPFTPRNIDDIAALLNGLSNGTIQLSRCPVTAILRSYWATFSHVDHPNLKKDFMPRQFSPAKAEYGVPRGTVIAWSPSYQHLNEEDSVDGQPRLVPPPGWAICDGTPPTPDLQDRFVRGATTMEGCGSGGARSHGHSVSTGKPSLKNWQNICLSKGRGKKGYDETLVGYHVHPANAAEAANEPLHFSLIYIMKVS